MLQGTSRFFFRCTFLASALALAWGCNPPGSQTHLDKRDRDHGFEHPGFQRDGRSGRLLRQRQRKLQHPADRRNSRDSRSRPPSRPAFQRRRIHSRRQPHGSQLAHLDFIRRTRHHGTERALHPSQRHQLRFQSELCSLRYRCRSSGRRQCRDLQFRKRKRSLAALPPDNSG